MKRTKTGGRTKGTPNKTTKQLRDVVQAFIESNIEDMQLQYDALDTPKDKLACLDRMFRHVLPSPVTELEQLSDEALDALITKLKQRNDNTQRQACNG